MAKKEMKPKKQKKKKSIFLLLLWWLFLLVKFILTIPFFILNGVFILFRHFTKGVKAAKVISKRSSIKPEYQPFSVKKTLAGDYSDWEDQLMKSDSTIGIILGARGTGKSALALKMFENIYEKTNTKLYAMGFKKEQMPSWIEVVDTIDKIKNDSHVLIDEGGILFSSRKSMSKPNKLLSELMLVARHKNLSILFISQNSSNLEVNILRQADYLLLKPSSLLQKNFERKIIEKIYSDTQKDFNALKSDKGLTYIHSDKFSGFISNPLPSFWNVAISKSWDNKLNQ